MAKSKQRFGRGTGKPHPVDVHVGERVWRRRRLLLALMALGLAWPADAVAQQTPEPSDTISGQAVALDGDTLLIDGRPAFMGLAPHGGRCPDCTPGGRRGDGKDRAMTSTSPRRRLLNRRPRVAQR